MKKYLSIVPISFLFLIFISVVPVKADTPSDYTSDFPNRFYGRVYEPSVNRYTWTFVMSAGSMDFIVNDQGFTCTISSGSDWWDIQKVGLADCPSLSDLDWYHLYWTNQRDFSFGTVFDAVIVVGNVTINSTVPVYNSPYDYQESLTPEPSDPEPGSTWLEDMWEWFLWQLGINDDYSGDIDYYITGGDREPFELVTPSPTPSPTPVPSPTPYSLDIVDNNGNSVYTITGIPGNTYNITNTTNNNDGSDFDIFEVDFKIGDGGSSNPRDGLNDVMDTSLTYLSDPENVNMQPVGDSFSIIPNDWFLIIGICACFPFIAGFISKLLK